MEGAPGSAHEDDVDVSRRTFLRTAGLGVAALGAAALTPEFAVAKPAKKESHMPQTEIKTQRRTPESPHEALCMKFIQDLVPLFDKMNVKAPTEEDTDVIAAEIGHYLNAFAALSSIQPEKRNASHDALALNAAIHEAVVVQQIRDMRLIETLISTQYAFEKEKYEKEYGAKSVPSITPRPEIGI
jgi:hypothetical protein